MEGPRARAQCTFSHAAITNHQNYLTVLEVRSSKIKVLAINFATSVGSQGKLFPCLLASIRTLVTALVHLVG